MFNTKKQLIKFAEDNARKKCKYFNDFIDFIDFNDIFYGFIAGYYEDDGSIFIQGNSINNNKYSIKTLTGECGIFLFDGAIENVDGRWTRKISQIMIVEYNKNEIEILIKALKL